MPLLFSYGSLQQQDVQLATYGRLLNGQQDALIGFAPSRVKIKDTEVAQRLGMTHHANAVPSDGDARVTGSAYEVTEDELRATDEYERPFLYRRVLAPLASGREAWVYIHTPDAPGAAEA